MPFCPNCGEPLNEGDMFCYSCGTAVSNRDNGQRRQEYTGKLIKCPNCGETLKSFLTECPACGYELRGVKGSDTIKELTLRLEKCESPHQQIILVKNFPVPNTKEDILEFIIIAASNLDSTLDENGNPDLFDAWLVKVEQCYQKAELLFHDDSDFQKIQGIYSRVKKKIHKKKSSRTVLSVLKVIARNAGVTCGLIALLIAVGMDKAGENASMVELLAMIVLIVSAGSLGKRRTSLLDFLISAASGVVSILLSFLFDNGSLVELCGGIVIIVAAVCYFKNMAGKPETE